MAFTGRLQLWSKDDRSHYPAPTVWHAVLLVCGLTSHLYCEYIVHTNQRILTEPQLWGKVNKSSLYPYMKTNDGELESSPCLWLLGRLSPEPAFGVPNSMKTTFLPLWDLAIFLGTNRTGFRSDVQFSVATPNNSLQDFRPVEQSENDISRSFIYLYL